MCVCFWVFDGDMFNACIAVYVSVTVARVCKLQTFDSKKKKVWTHVEKSKNRVR